VYIDYLPLYSIGLGWILPAVVGAIIGYFWPTGSKKTAVIQS
jgi:LIVCS family branched-chain amino acid:cation transporter